MKSTVTITPDATLGGARVQFRYDPDVVDVIKTLHFVDRRWNPDAKSWWVAAAAVNELHAILEAAGYTVISTMRGHRATPPPRPGREDRDTWADKLLDAVGPVRIDAVFRALTKVLHPDLPTGDTVLAQQLNAARDRRAVRS